MIELVYALLSAPWQVCMCVYVIVYVHAIDTYMGIRKNAYANTCIYGYTYTYAYTYTYTYAYAYTYTYTYRRRRATFYYFVTRNLHIHMYIYV